MAKVGKLRYRDGRLIVEGMAGEVLAEVEPDDDMVIDTIGLDSARLLESIGVPLPPAIGLTGQVSVRWWQTVDDPGGYIDADVIDVDAREVAPPPRPELDRGD